MYKRIKSPEVDKIWSKHRNPVPYYNRAVTGYLSTLRS